jgi:hypothetical protein
MTTEANVPRLDVLVRPAIRPCHRQQPLGRDIWHTRGSALLGWVGNDAAYLAEQITGRMTGGRP